MRVSIEKVSPGAKGIWTSEIDPQRLLRLANPIRQGGRINIVMISEPSFDNQKNSIQFDLDSAILLNLGNTSETVLIDSRDGNAIETVRKKRVIIHESKGDQKFISELSVLPDSLRKIGERLVKEVRKLFPGELKFHPITKKFVESPDNFWVVRVQPRAKSLRIIVYGLPEAHRLTNTIKLKRDMSSYSTFILEREHQLPEAVEIIREAKKLKDQR
jgi:hypothetical protein